VDKNHRGTTKEVEKRKKSKILFINLQFLLLSNYFPHFFREVTIFLKYSIEKESMH